MKEKYPPKGEVLAAKPTKKGKFVVLKVTEGEREHQGWQRVAPGAALELEQEGLVYIPDSVKDHLK